MQLNKGCVFIDPYNLLLCQWNLFIYKIFSLICKKKELLSPRMNFVDKEV